MSPKKFKKQAPDGRIVPPPRKVLAGASPLKHPRPRGPLPALEDHPWKSAEYDFRVQIKESGNKSGNPDL
jgi:hypothetical protein